MATLNYSNRLQNIQNRKYDPELRVSLMSESASAKSLPEDVRYLIESMRTIDDSYNKKTINAAERVQTHLETNFNLHFNRAYRTQGSVITNTNIKIHSDFDLLAIIDKYFYPEKSPSNVYTESDPNDDIREMRKQSIRILKEIYDEVDDTGEKNISIYNKSLKRKVDIVFCYWYHSTKYEETKGDGSYEYYRGIYLYKFPTGPKEKDFPFAHIHNVNYKGDITNDGSRKGIRLLKTLKADCESSIDNLKGFHLTSIVHSIENDQLFYRSGDEINIAKAISGHINLIINNPEYRKSILSPNGTEYPFLNDKIVTDLIILRQDLDTLIEDSIKDITNSQSVRSAILTY